METIFIYCNSSYYMGLFDNDSSRTRELKREDYALAEKIQRFRRERGMTQEELSEKIGRNSSYIAYVETHRRGLSLPVVYKLARVLKIKLKDLFDF